MSRIAFATLLAGMLSLGCLIAPAAADGQWVVTRSSGDVRIHRAGGWTPVSTRPDLQPGDSVWTGASGRVLLRHPKGILVVAPGSMIRIPDQDYGSNRTILFQYKGQVSADVAKQPYEHFEVHTPLLAAVVKGTRFTVTIGEAGTVVSVDSGVVQVRDSDTRQSASLGAGRAVATSNRAGAGLSQQIDSRDVSPSELRAAAESGEMAEQTPGASSAGGVDARAASGAAVNSALDSTVNPAGNVRGNANAAANSNAGGNSNANSYAGGIGNAGGNGNAAANSNAGGNGNGNAGGNGNAAANSNAGGNGNSNAGGNGNGVGVGLQVGGLAVTVGVGN